MHRSSTLTILVLALVSLTGCGRVVSMPTVALDLAGPVAVDLESFGGQVIVKASPDITNPRVKVELETTHGFMRHDEGIRSLLEIDYSVDVVGGSLGQTLRIRASTRHAEPHFQRVNFKIEVPEVQGLRIHTSNGKVEAFGVAGAIDIRTSDGNVRLATPLPLREPVSIVDNQGTIEMRVRGESAGELDLQTVGGRVFPWLRYGETIVHPGTSDVAFLATWNEGNNPIVLRAVDGDIRFVVVPDPLGMGQYIAW